ncbi:thermonuclease family protein [Pseudoruegeria sp. SHC-113]|uniref:thermonuclease family protein n=1 Tax=Pseudoruegeria sp. SHC-113 TaxID=2855439 RepID=UPI0021BB0E09|nr:thermonuclease family protein [Pseudoruegeria sp. SHC-113]MCT8159678.1 thermonuclease family protein [Pseudoruegeria sp. SHC-113]
MTRFLLLFALLLATPLAAAPFGGRVEVSDGDSLRMGSTRIRLFGIDAPELDQSCRKADGRVWACGDWAKATLAGLVAGQKLSCQQRDTDRYGRVVASCTAGGKDLGAEMVRLGAAMAYRKYALDYVDLEKQAVFAKRGIWAGEVRAPEDHRRGKAAAPAAQAQPLQGCVIKGNISGNGQIYHMPGQADYTKVRINTAKGERWFSSEGEAQAAGWRRARR